jgi:hypothetical protein
VYSEDPVSNVILLALFLIFLAACAGALLGNVINRVRKVRRRNASRPPSWSKSAWSEYQKRMRNKKEQLASQ